MNSDIYNSNRHHINSDGEYNSLKLKLDNTLKMLEADHLEIQYLWKYIHSLEKLLENTRYFYY